MIRQLSAPHLKAMIDSCARFELVDVRTEEERAVARIEGSRLLDRACHDHLRRPELMRPVIRFFFVVVGLMLVHAFAAHAQQRPRPPVFTADTELVLVDFVVTDKAGRPVRGLSAKDGEGRRQAAPDRQLRGVCGRRAERPGHACARG